MTEPITDAGVEELRLEECLKLLAAGRVGRLAFSAGDDLAVLPVNFLFDRGTVVFRTARGSKLDAAVRRARIAFEVDEVRAPDEPGDSWSVLVKGTVEEIWQPEELQRLGHLDLQPWAQGEKPHYARVVSSAITGRRLRGGPHIPSRWWG